MTELIYLKPRLNQSSQAGSTAGTQGTFLIYFIRLSPHLNPFGLLLAAPRVRPAEQVAIPEKQNKKMKRNA